MKTCSTGVREIYPGGKFDASHETIFNKLHKLGIKIPKRNDITSLYQFLILGLCKLKIISTFMVETSILCMCRRHLVYAVISQDSRTQYTYKESEGKRKN